MVELFVNSGDPDQTPPPRSVASDLGLHCLPVTLLEDSRLQKVKDSLQLQTHFDIFGNKCYRRNEGSLFYFSLQAWI